MTMDLSTMTAIAVITGFALLALLAKRRGRRRGRPVYLPFDESIALGTLADNTVTTAALQTLQQDFDVYGIRATVTFTGVTVGEGPLEVGWCQAELTGTQILAQRDAAPTSQWDVLAQEQARRKVRVFGTSSGLAAGESLNEGKMIWKKMFLRKPSGQALADLWVLNRTGAALTTGASVHFSGSVVGAWK